MRTPIYRFLQQTFLASLLACWLLSFSSCILIMEVSLTLTPSVAYVFTSQSTTLVASGGSGGFTFTLTSGEGSISSDGTYTAGSNTGTATITVTSGGKSATATINIANPLAVAPPVKALIVGQTKQLTTSGGFPPYTFSVNGTGSISQSGLYSAASTYGKDVVTITDAQQNTITASLYTLNQMAFWIDASEITSLDDGDGIATWTDSSGSGNDASQAVPGWQPIYYADHPISPNQQPCALFYNHFLQVREFLTVNQMTIASVGHFIDGFFFVDDAPGGRDLWFGIIDDAGTDRYSLRVDDGTTEITSSTLDDSQARLFAGRVRNTIASTTTDGVFDQSSDGAYVPGNWSGTGATFVTGPLIGFLSTGGYMCEQIVYNNGNLPTAEFTNLQCYLSEKYDMSNSLTCP